MSLLDAQQQRLLDRLRQAGDQPVAFAELHATGITFPAAVISELEMNGYVIERVHHKGQLIWTWFCQVGRTDPPVLQAFEKALGSGAGRDFDGRVVSV
jgi:hypothetical protein